MVQGRLQHHYRPHLSRIDALSYQLVVSLSLGRRLKVEKGPPRNCMVHCILDDATEVRVAQFLIGEVPSVLYTIISQLSGCIWAKRQSTLYVSLQEIRRVYIVRMTFRACRLIPVQEQISQRLSFESGEWP